MQLICFIPVLDNNGTVNKAKETKSMLEWLLNSFSPSLSVVLRSGDLLVLYPHQTKTAPLSDLDRQVLVNLGLVYADNHPVMQGKKFGCPDRKTLRDPSLGIVEASTFNTHSGSLMVSVFLTCNNLSRGLWNVKLVTVC